MIPIRDTIPTRSWPVMTWLLIAANLAAFVYELGLSPRETPAFLQSFGLVPARFGGLAAGAPPDLDMLGALAAPFLTSMFLHGGWLHLISNMWVLWIFGDNVEDRMGWLRYLLFYVLMGVAAAGVHVATNLGSDVPTIGASGAVAGVMGAYFVLFPGARVVVLVPVIIFPLFFQIPAFLFLGLWFALQFVQGSSALAAGPDASGGIAWWAHIGGFVAGLLTFSLFLRPKPRRRSATDES